ncbi:transketolase [Pseudoclavibacter sp. JAI123]|jgi:transketolase|uniref:transketolase family protein n=1 Tax=Pseudoclavibacter sp. JAI123 TaxID=2723065 RepID=UPI0015CBE207|nr:transketolase C-terminal domain-containing protein [Pseudoclavibacter sp. JAI123]NYF15140.1 transketolase [Pseudoclavibacter sp. JAI123]
MTGPKSKKSWQYRALNELNPDLDYLSLGLDDLVKDGVPVVAGTADLKYSNGLQLFERQHPDRFVQFGISEQHMVSAAAGMATCGLMPFVATFASFLGLLCCEQIRMDLGYTKLPVRLVGHHTGISLGFYGTSHHATEDISTTRAIAGLTVISPSDGRQLRAALRASAHWPEPIYFRIGRGRDPQVYGDDVEFTIGKGIEHSRGTDVTFMACGALVHPALEAARRLTDEGYSVGVVDMATIKPLDAELVAAVAERSAVIITAEEHNILGGLGSAVAEVLAERSAGARLVRHGLRDEYSLIGPPTHLYRHYGLDADGLVSIARQQL